MIPQSDIRTDLVEVVITNTTFNGDAFGATSDGDNVYISPTLVERFQVEVGQVRKVKLAANSPMHVERGVPWRVFYVEPLGTQMVLPGFEPQPEEQPEPDSYDDEVLSRIHRDGAISTGEVCDLLGLTANKARKLMERLHRHGDVVRADIHESWGQKKASKTVWLADARHLYRGAK